MDSLTPIVIGAAVEEAVLGKGIGNKACYTVLLQIQFKI
tara:strand:+ start:387 stop:503 length:117 start_codon:yes stop_codon:yes gene_type:complete